jgi:hypothetical protein
MAQLKVRLVRSVEGIPAGSVGDVVSAVQGNGILATFRGREKPVLVRAEHAELFRKP